MEVELFDKTRSYLEQIGLPRGDFYHLPTSDGVFADGGHFRIEVPTINTLAAARELLNQAQRQGIVINRITETYGLFRHTRSQIQQYVELANEHQVQLVMSIGPRAGYDTSASAKSAMGKSISYRLRGQEQIIRSIEDVNRAFDLGVRNFVIYDEGLLWLLNEMRKDGHLDNTIRFKLSAHCGHGNPASLRLLQQIGADSINPVRDLDLPMIAALRAAVDVPLDIHTDTPVASGGFIRFYEAPEIVRIAAPVYLKVGNSVLEQHGQLPTPQDMHMMLNNVCIVLELIARFCPEYKQS